jgi:hypothetical protein
MEWMLSVNLNVSVISIIRVLFYFKVLAPPPASSSSSSSQPVTVHCWTMGLLYIRGVCHNLHAWQAGWRGGLGWRAPASHGYNSSTKVFCLLYCACCILVHVNHFLELLYQFKKNTHQNPLGNFKGLSIHRDRQREATMLYTMLF